MQQALKYAPLAVAIALTVGLMFTISGWVSDLGGLNEKVDQLDEDVVALDAKVTRLEERLNDLDDSVNNLRVELLEEFRASQDVLRRDLLDAVNNGTVMTARDIHGHRHGPDGEVYVDIR